MKILVLDDEPDVIVGDAYKEGSPKWIAYTEAMGMEIIFVTTPSEAEARLQKEEFALLLLDGYLMEGQENGKTLYGPEVLANWLERGLSLPPVYMISTDPDMCQYGITAGAKGKVDKDLLWRTHCPQEVAQKQQTLRALMRKD